MKFPLEQSPFPPLKLSPRECDEYEDVATTLLRDTLGEYDDYVTCNRQVNTKNWREVKTRENVTVYRRTRREDRRERTPAFSTSSSGDEFDEPPVAMAHQSVEWQLPKMMGVGRIVGTLDDVLYGLFTPTSDAMNIKTTYVEDQMVDNRVLCHIKHSTPQDPFQFLGIKWAVKSQVLQSIVRPRDCMYLELTGICTRVDGDRIGYLVMHSVDIPGYGELASLGIVRSRFSSCYLFRETTQGSVEMYMRTFIDPGGSIADSLAILGSANGLIAIWKVTWSAQCKKLAWMMRQSSASRAMPTRPADGEKIKHCSVCAKRVSGFRTLATCELCLNAVCSRCLSTRKLTYLRESGKLLQIPTKLCTHCLKRAAMMSPADIAVLEYIPKSTKAHYQEMADIAAHQQWLREQARRRPPSPPPPTEAQLHWAMAGAIPPLSSSVSVSASVSADSESSRSEQDREPGLIASPHSGGGTGTPGSSRSAATSVLSSSERDAGSGDADPEAAAERQKELWAQMKQLQITAELTYLHTKRNAEVMKAMQQGGSL